MSPGLALATGNHALAMPAELNDAVRDAINASVAANTQRAYQSDLRTFTTWCSEQGVTPLPADPGTVGAYLAWLVSTGRKVTTVRRHLASISKAHQLAGVANPAQHEVVRGVMGGLQRQHGRTPDRATPLLATDVRRLLAGIVGDDAAAVRDRALVLVGWHGALRRQELANLTWGDVQQRPDGLVLELRGTKTDKAGEGQQVGLHREERHEVCPVAALQAWHRVCTSAGRGDSGAAVFPRLHKSGRVTTQALSGQGVALVLSRRAEAVGLEGVTGHSLRRGLVHQAHLAGVSDSRVMAATRHKSLTMLRIYQGEAGLVEQAPGRGLL
jgi:integrase